MICPNCNTNSSRVMFSESGASCTNCGSLSATGGTRLSGILTRNSTRVKKQQDHFLADMVQPHVHDPVSGKDVPNPEFVKLYPQHTSTYYDEKDIKASGDKKLTKLWQKQDAEKRAHKQQLDKLSNPKRQKGDAAKTANFVKGL